MFLGDLPTLNKENGRIIRQGNNNHEIEVIRYVTKQSFDAYIWQIIETKQKFISQLFAGSKEIRSMTDLDNNVINIAEIKAIATGKKEIQEKFEIDMQIQELKLKERNYKNQQYRFEDKLKSELPAQIERSMKFLENCKQDLIVKNNESSEQFSIFLNNKIFIDIKEAGNEIIKSINPVIPKDVLYKIGKYKGFDICLENRSFENNIYIQGSNNYKVTLSKVPSLNIERIDGEIGRIETCIRETENLIKDLERQKEQCKLELEKPFADEDKLKGLLERQSELDNILNLDNEKQEQTLLEDNIVEEIHDEKYIDKENEMYDTLNQDLCDIDI